MPAAENQRLPVDVFMRLHGGAPSRRRFGEGEYLPEDTPAKRPLRPKGQGGRSLEAEDIDG